MDLPVRFAVVREDHLVERALLTSGGAQEALLIASGGCTALELHHQDPSLALTLVDRNPAQLALVEAKYRALRNDRATAVLARWRVGCDDPEGLLGVGRFEGLFRVLRSVLDEFVAPAAQRRAAFDRDGRLADAFCRWQRSSMWPVAFDLAFADVVLRELFGDAAVQNPPAGGYARHFQRAFERGLERADARTNRFLQLLLLGHALDEAGSRPGYLEANSGVPSARLPELIPGGLEDVPDLGRFGLLSLSNIVDWMGAAERAALVRDLTARCRAGSTLLLRGIASLDSLRALLGREWRLDERRAHELRGRARDLFYSDLLIATRT